MCFQGPGVDRCLVYVATLLATKQDGPSDMFPNMAGRWQNSLHETLQKLVI
jgi:hypothetical protein